MDNNKLFKNFSQEEIAEIHIRLNEIAATIGIIGLPDQTIVGVMATYIPAYYPELSLAMLSKAFMDNAAGRLSCIENGKEIDRFIPYNNSFDWTFVSAVLTAFKKQKQTKNASAPTYTPESRQLNPKSPMEQCKEDFQFMVNWAAAIGQVPEQGNFTNCYAYAFETYLINPSEPEKKEIAIQVASEVNREADKLQSEHERKDYRKLFAKGSPAFINRCRETYFKKWLQSEIDQNRSDLKTWAENISQSEIKTA